MVDRDLLDAINDLHRQATHERSHFYVASVLERCDAEIRQLRAELKETRNALAAYAQDRWGGGTAAVEKLLGIKKRG